MFKQVRSKLVNQQDNIPAPVKGLNAMVSLMRLPPQNAHVLENWFCQADELVVRQGNVDHVTGFAHTVNRLHTYAALNGGESLWATTSDGIFDASTAGAVGAAAIALTNGFTISTAIATGAGSYMMVVNGVDTMKQYDGAAWTSIAVLGAVATSDYSYVETYRQRLFFVKKSSLDLAYLAANAIAGAPTAYPMGAIFRKGGYIVAIGTWTIDGGVGPEDQLAVLTNKGEVAVFSGSDPATWSFNGVYFIGRPLGTNPLFKYGGDLLILTEKGVYPLSSAMQSVAVERTSTVTTNIQPLISAYAVASSASEGWQVISDPLAPFLLVNLPLTPVRKQLIMNSQTGAWSHYSGFEAQCWARRTSEMYFGTTNAVCRVTGYSDNGANIVATMVQAPSKMGYPRNKKIEELRGYFEASGGFSYQAGVASQFGISPDTTLIDLISSGSSSLWGTALWGSGVWGSSTQANQEWITVPDEYTLWKALYIQVTSNVGSVSYLGSDVLMTAGSTF
jgi:hypothetical protein